MVNSCEDRFFKFDVEIIRLIKNGGCFMIEKEEKQLLDEIMKDSSPVLFLGAGFSKGSKNENNTLDGKGIWNLILESLVLKKADESDIDEIKGYNLRRLCEYVYTLYGGKKELTELLTSCFKGTKPDGNKFHLKLTSYPWKKIFTVNIDDLIENMVFYISMFDQGRNSREAL